jgi:hypothetical protein
VRRVCFDDVASIEGLYLHFAVICERVLRETDEVLSFIRVVDQITVSVVTSAGLGLPLNLPFAPSAPLTFAVGFKSAGYVGPVPVRIRVETPSGAALPEFETTPSIAAETDGLNLIFPIQLPVQDEGIYWFAVEVSGDVLTRVPLRVSRQIVQQAVSPPA